MQQQQQSPLHVTPDCRFSHLTTHTGQRTKHAAYSPHSNFLLTDLYNKSTTNNLLSARTTSMSCGSWYCCCCCMMQCTVGKHLYTTNLSQYFLEFILRRSLSEVRVIRMMHTSRIPTRLTALVPALLKSAGACYLCETSAMGATSAEVRLETCMR